MSALLMSKNFVKIVVVLISLIAVLGVQAVKSHYKTIKTEIQDGVRGATPWEYEVKRQGELIRDETERIMEFEGKIAEVEASAESHQADAEKIEKSLEMDRKDLAVERDLLSSDKQKFMIRGVSYSRQQVVASAEARLAQIERDASTLDAKRQAIVGLEQEIEKGYADLREAYALRDSMVRELEALSAKMVNIEMRKEMQDLAQSLKGGSLVGGDSELSKSMQQLRQRVQKEERKLNAASQTQSAPAIITHESPSRPGLMEEMDRVLGTSAKPKTLETEASAEQIPTIQH